MKIGVDLGGTKIEVVVIDDNGQIVFKHRIVSPRDDYLKTIAAIYDLVTTAVAKVKLPKLHSIGIGTPGVLSPVTGLLRNSNSTWLNGKPLQKDLELALNCKVYLENDANCMTLSEAVDGAGAGHKVVFAAILGTGCGGGVAINQQINHGHNGLGGEWGHNPLPWMDDDERAYAKTVSCYCGRIGCIEHFLSGSGFAAYYNYRRSGTNLDSRQIFALAATGDVLANECIELYETRLAKSFGHVINLLDPDIIVAAGGMSNIDRIYQNVNKQLKNWVFGNECNTKFVKAQHGDSSGVRGAAWLND
jgi:fructokinase